MNKNKAADIRSHIDRLSKVKWEEITFRSAPRNFITGIGTNEQVGGGIYSTTFMNTLLPDTDEEYDEQESEIKAITRMTTSAVNSTYGAGINPEAVPKLLEILTEWIREVNSDDLKSYPLSSYKKILLRKAEAVLEKAKL